MMGIVSAGDLAAVAAAVGLASNLAAVRALATDGIQRGHMALHARSVALAAGAEGSEVERVAATIVEARDVTVEAARRALEVDRTERVPTTHVTPDLRAAAVAIAKATGDVTAV
jgi:hydroxymethylglutaryl-CoA reductase